MAYDTRLAERIISLLKDTRAVDERKMFGGVAWMINGNLAVGVHGNDMIVRVGPEGHAAAMSMPHTKVFDISGRPMTGWVMVELAGVQDQASLEEWVDLGVNFAQSLPPK